MSSITMKVLTFYLEKEKVYRPSEGLRVETREILRHFLETWSVAMYTVHIWTKCRRM